jgi:hypothetical protein
VLASRQLCISALVLLLTTVGAEDGGKKQEKRGLLGLGYGTLGGYGIGSGLTGYSDTGLAVPAHVAAPAPGPVLSPPPVYAPPHVIGASVHTTITKQVSKVSTTPWRCIGGVEVQLHSFFHLGTRWRWVLASRSGRFTPRERDPLTLWIGGWVSSRSIPNAVVKRKIPSSRRESNPWTPIAQPVAQRYTDWAITAL